MDTLIHWEEEAGSTNSVLKERAASLPHGYTIAVRRQTAGHGQRGTTWESATGLNLTFSMLLRPEGVRPAEQFCISEAVALGVAGVLSRHLPAGTVARVKWPNDIYVGNRKICGILIEHSLAGAGRITHSIAGIGVNVNQREFVSDAPNPVSLSSITGSEFAVEPLLEEFVAQILQLMVLTATPEGRARLHVRYLASLWRGNGRHPFALPDGTRFNASVDDVAPDGRLTLRLADGTLRSFYFKEVVFILPPPGTDPTSDSEDTPAVCTF